MPKAKRSLQDRLNKIVEDFGNEHIKSHADSIICVLCKTSIRGSKSKYLKQHCNSKKHIYHVNLFTRVGNEQSSISTDNQVKDSEFYRDLCEMMVKCNIPFHKLENSYFKDFLEKYTQRIVR